MLKMRDKYLHTNCLAALANMSAQFRDLHPYVSQRLVSLFETLAKKYQKLVQQIENDKNSEKIETKVSIESAIVEQDRNVLEEVLRMVLEIFNSCLTNQLSNNPNLVYTLLYKKEIFEPFKNSNAFQDVVENISIVIDYFSQILQSKAQSNEVDATQVLSIIQQGTREWPKDKLTVKLINSKIRFLESNNSCNFRNFLN